jgi:hypothetical protein
VKDFGCWQAEVGDDEFMVFVPTRLSLPLGLEWLGSVPLEVFKVYDADRAVGLVHFQRMLGIDNAVAEQILVGKAVRSLTDGTAGLPNKRNREEHRGCRLIDGSGNGFSDRSTLACGEKQKCIVGFPSTFTSCPGFHKLFVARRRYGFALKHCQDAVNIVPAIVQIHLCEWRLSKRINLDAADVSIISRSGSHTAPAYATLCRTSS